MASGFVSITTPPTIANNIGTGDSVLVKAGPNILNFKTFVAGSGVAISTTGTEVTIGRAANGSQFSYHLIQPSEYIIINYGQHMWIYKDIDVEGTFEINGFALITS